MKICSSNVLSVVVGIVLAGATVAAQAKNVCLKVEGTPIYYKVYGLKNTTKLGAVSSLRGYMLLDLNVNPRPQPVAMQFLLTGRPGQKVAVSGVGDLLVNGADMGTHRLAAAEADFRTLAASYRVIANGNVPVVLDLDSYPCKELDAKVAALAN